MLSIILSLALAFSTSLCLKRLPFPHNWIVGGTLAANFAFGAFFVELCALSSKLAALGLPLLLFDAGFLLCLFVKMLFEFPDEGDVSAATRIWTALAYGFSGPLLVGATILGMRLSCPVYFWIHRAEFEKLVSAEPERPRIALSVELGLDWHKEFIYDPTHGGAENLWSAKEPFERAQRLSGTWYARSSD